MANTANDARLEALTHRLQEELVDERGRAAEPDDVETVVAAEAEAFSGAPVQDFVVLLVENKALDHLRERGLHRELPTQETEAPHTDREAPASS
jgi:hypothetical protein